MPTNLSARIAKLEAAEAQQKQQQPVVIYIGDRVITGPYMTSSPRC